MAKKIKRVVVTQAYFDVLKGKADLLDRSFGYEDACSVDVGMLKDYQKLSKIGYKIEDSDLSDVEPYVEPKPEPKPKRGARGG